MLQRASMMSRRAQIARSLQNQGASQLLPLPLRLRRVMYACVEFESEAQIWAMLRLDESLKSFGEARVEDGGSLFVLEGRCVLCSFLRKRGS